MNVKYYNIGLSVYVTVVSIFVDRVGILVLRKKSMRAIILSKPKQIDINFVIHHTTFSIPRMCVKVKTVLLVGEFTNPVYFKGYFYESNKLENYLLVFLGLMQ